MSPQSEPIAGITDTQYRERRIREILQQFTPFTEPDTPRPRIRYVRRSSRTSLGFWTKLAPVAFRSDTTFEDNFLFSSLSAYLFLAPNGRLVGSRQRPDGHTYYFYLPADDPYAVTDKDMERLKIGVRGDFRLLAIQHANEVVMAKKEHPSW